MKSLVLNVTREYFEQIKSGEKTEEYRKTNDYWAKRIAKRYDQVIIKMGYPKSGDSAREIVFPWNGFEVRTITHKHFGDQPVRVFAIKLQKGAEEMNDCIQKYLASGGTLCPFCPFCGSDEISGGRFDIAGENVCQGQVCRTCGEEWRTRSKRVGVHLAMANTTERRNNNQTKKEPKK